MDPAHDILRRVFGYDAFRGQQEAVVAHLASGKDCLVLMPTGGGKSLCYQIPALLRPGTAIVVSPLIALMQDQVEALRQVGVRAAYLNSSLAAGEALAVERGFLAGDYDLLYVAPERLLTPRFLGLMEQAQLALFAIDEAHCVSQWGHDFRPEYRELALLHERWPQVPRIALTATADAPTRREIVERLGLEGAAQFVSSFDRPNIRYRVVQKQDARRQLLDMLAAHPGDSGIVYCLSRRKVDDTAEWLQDQGVSALPYHAGMDSAARSRHQRRFLQEDGIVMVATIAFGMGIDKPDVRFVAHLDLPKSLEGYYQETGRAGRDGAPAEAWLAYGLGDLVTHRQMIDASESDQERKWVERRKLDALLGYCESLQCRRVQLLAYFGETYTPPARAVADAADDAATGTGTEPGTGTGTDTPRCGNCDNCLAPPETWDGTEAAQKALSVVYRTGQRFGAGHLIDVLRGSSSGRVAQLGHDRLPTHGVGADLDVATWRSVFRQLVAAGYLDVDSEGYGTLRLAAPARAVLKGEVRVALRRDLAPKRSRGSKRSRGGDASADLQAVRSPLDGEALARFERLRAWRSERAREQNLPAYIIFHDATLQDIAQANPPDLATLATVNGVGATKLDRYGEDVLAVLQETLAPTS